MRFPQALLPAILLSCCTASTITVELAPSSEAQVNFAKSVTPEESAIKEVTIPASGSIDVPFTVQAPLANWEDPYQEACEEASVVMLDYFIRGLTFTPDQANRELLQLINWEQSNHYPQDVTINQLANIVEEYYGYQTRVTETVTAESIMYEIASGHPVIVPAAGRRLGNPYFSGEGPWYHMLVITGYDRKNFTTNDPGTKRGEDYKYKHNILIDAIHDWTGVKEEIETGPKKMLIINQ